MSQTDTHQFFPMTLKDTVFYFTASKSISCTATVITISVFFSMAPDADIFDNVDNVGLINGQLYS